MIVGSCCHSRNGLERSGRNGLKRSNRNAFREIEPRFVATRTLASRQRGFALVMVLWLGGLVTVMAAGFAFGARTETTQSFAVLEQGRAAVLAEAGIRRAIVSLVERRTDRRWDADGRVREWEFGGGRVQIRVGSESGKIDLNRAPEELLKGLFRVVAEDLEEFTTEQAEDVAAAVLDWRDKDDRTRPGGAEKADYDSAGRPYGPRNQPFASLLELDQLLGMTDAVAQKVRTAITVNGGSSRLDATTASRLALRALPGVAERSVDEFLAERERWLEAKALDPDGRQQMSVASLQGGSRYVSRSRARVYTVTAVARLPSGTVAIREAAIRISSRAKSAPFTILQWSERWLEEDEVTDGENVES